MKREDAYVERWLVIGKRAPCGHLSPCGCENVTNCCAACPLRGCKWDGHAGTARVELRAMVVEAGIANGQSRGKIAAALGLTPNALTQVLIRARRNRAKQAERSI